MCGIGGVFGAPAPPGALEAMVEEMEHRGPDDSGIWKCPDGGLAFRRLAIIDLDPRSNQPVEFEGLHLVFNGEIYNFVELREELERLGHRFVTSGDAEVLVHAWAEWGPAALDRLNGMFALAVWDSARRELFLASDPFGEKPLYWTERDGRLFFCSDIRGLRLAAPGIGAPDSDATASFVANGYMPPVDRSFFAGVRRVPAATLLRFRDGAVTSSRYWEPQRVDVGDSYPDAVERLRELLEDSVRLRLRSDVPIGTSLSGGVDSSAVLALAGLLGTGATRHAFTASFPGSPKDEWELAHQVAGRVGVDEHHRVVPIGEEALTDLSILVGDQEEPFGSLSIYAQWRVYRAAKEAGVTVLLDGQGGDELFGGYPGTAGWAKRSEGVPAALSWALRRPESVRELLVAYASESLPRGAASSYRRRLASPYASRDAIERAGERNYGESSEQDPLRRELLRQSFETSLPALLRYADRDSMAHSREVRLPLLDRRVAEFALSCPPSYLISQDGRTKRILRDAVRDLVPAEVLAKRDKIGFEPPQEEWLATRRARGLVRDALQGGPVVGSGLFDHSAIQADLERGRWSDANGIWRALSVALWSGEFT